MTNTRWIVYTIFVYLTTIPFSLAQNLKRFVWINTVCITFAVLCLSYIIIDSLFVITEPELRTKDPLVFFSFSHFLKFFGIANFSLEGVNLIIPIQSQMRRPKKFNFYLILTTGFDVLVSVFISVTCYTVIVILLKILDDSAQRSLRELKSVFSSPSLHYYSNQQKCKKILDLSETLTRFIC